MLGLGGLGADPHAIVASSATRSSPGRLEISSGKRSQGISFARQIDLVEAGSIPKLLADVVELRLRHESVSRDEVRALWLGAGLATHVGLAIFEEPERFITAGKPSPASPAAALAA